MSVSFHMRGDLERLEAETDLLWAAGCTGIAQEGDEVVAYFDEPVDLPLTGSWQEVDETDYLAAYYAELKPVTLERLIIAPTHCKISPSETRPIIWLDPGMAFGTGHHATTYLALATLEKLELASKRVLDVGAGSGILTIAADLLGADEAVGIDIDPLTLPVAEENRALNCSKATFELGTLDSAISENFDIVTANLFAELHVELVAEYRRVLRSGGWLLATGILDERLELAEGALSAFFTIHSVQYREEWALILAQKEDEQSDTQEVT